ncbi:hypothetical protein CIPAW_05G241300 [Carya illinoinensis]|uniref:Uncharacterized protein n=1 Tax=Carya illinoinensis TaxID=32201 RepID=A0A8T1QMI9_CARIL|nr:hypothetical protein CIPAW_05G241300 [Carya illinoinensis]
MILPSVLIVSRRTVRKNKFVDFWVREYHLDLILSYGAVPVIVPRVSGVHMLLESFEPIHGVLLCVSTHPFTMQNCLLFHRKKVRELHASDTTIDKEIELRLAKLCLERNIPYLGICRGSQLLNSLEKELSKQCPELQRVTHLNYEDYDGHRHPVKVVLHTPLHHWFQDSLEDEKMELMVNSYHHQGVKRLAQRFVPMAFAVDDLVEGFYDPDAYSPGEGKFIMGLQFHPERMREFVKAVIAYERKLNCSASVPKGPKLNQEQETKRNIILKSISTAKSMCISGSGMVSAHKSELEVGAEFLEAEADMGATVRNASLYAQSLKLSAERERVARTIMEMMSIAQLSELMSIYRLMRHVCSEALEKNVQELMMEED